jgi:hypothetical protein
MHLPHDVPILKARSGEMVQPLSVDPEHLNTGIHFLGDIIIAALQFGDMKARHQRSGMAEGIASIAPKTARGTGGLHERITPAPWTNTSTARGNRSRPGFTSRQIHKRKS